MVREREKYGFLFYVQRMIPSMGIQSVGISSKQIILRMFSFFFVFILNIKLNRKHTHEANG